MKGKGKGGAATANVNMKGKGKGGAAKGVGKRSSAEERIEGWCLKCGKWGHKAAYCRSVSSVEPASIPVIDDEEW
eukprot:12609192-Heterocapsa_arctica.AAC.1